MKEENAEDTRYSSRKRVRQVANETFLRYLESPIPDQTGMMVTLLVGPWASHCVGNVT